MPNFGPDFDLATRLKRLEDWAARQNANPLGQAFSLTQSDGSVGLTMGQAASGSGGAALRFYQGPNTPRDANTSQHPMLLYLGQLVSGGQFVNSGMILYRPDGTESWLVGDRGVQIYDAHGNQVLGTDEYGSAPGLGLLNPLIPLGQPMTASPNGTGWPNTTSTTLTNIAYLQFPAQHSHLTWYGTTYCPAGTTGSVQVTVNNGAAGNVIGVGAGFTNLSEKFSMGTWNWQQVCQLAVQAEVTAGAGPISFAVFGVWGCGS